MNQKTCEFKIDYDSEIGYYSTRLSIDLIYLPLGSYTMVYEMYVDDGITVDQIDASSGTLSVGKINSRIDEIKTRSIIHFTKNVFHSGFDDLDIDIKLKGKTDPQTTIYVVVYGVKGYVNNVSVHLWDRLYYYDNDSVQYEAPINMNGKDITDVNKIVTDDLDVNCQIDMKNNKIIGVGDGIGKSDAINKAQLDTAVGLFTYLNIKFNLFETTVDNKLTQNSYYYFTDQLEHDNATLVKFPSGINSHPFSLGFNQYRFRISLSGNYHVIYTDFYKNDGDFKIWDRTNSIYLFVMKLDNKTDWTPITFNAVNVSL